MNATTIQKSNEKLINQECVFKLSDDEKEILYQELNQIQYDPTGSTRYITEVRMAALRAMPSRIIDCLNEQKASLKPMPYIILENLPVDKNVTSTPEPQIVDPDVKSGFISENLAIAVGSLIGEPYSMLHEGHNIVNNLIPSVEAKREYTGLGSEVELDFHIENAALKFMGDKNFSPCGLLLTGVRHDPQKPLTRIADGREALRLLSQSDIDLLCQPLYKIKVPYRWRLSIPGEMQETHLVPLIQGSIELPEIAAAFYPDMVLPANDLAATALRNFHEAIRKVSFGLDVSPGRLVYIDNRFTFHSRDAFEPSFDQSGRPFRWVQRVIVAPNLWNHRNLAQVKDRVFKPIFN
ncbi:TauD/TfdA family dioxygenase [Bacillus cereus]|uniref:TauD/TfdA family dioxygenase n=1 Tax=Bacillus cereus TaxID=1396 RepID=UPI000B4C05FD|nr:TauD/TfdA family dioxygenase [Bacillus cereus]MEC3196179.1 TauD/TfdA family dioxygenase [Bacillus cereus]PEX16923.1 taurine catabolism dioxygenase TauD [Bacillus cereus]PFC35638.1 taurine catabolism dioxygenase TauD [Bacillus cereus]PFQ72104.1 taurine catabolism dioxygenase TauD [Bacillus cereus]PFU10113.1 taurine catabolism dioxygenase TauD [Bacillus cereus]